MSNYAQHVSTRITPQSEPIPGKNQVENSAGGYAFPVDCWKRLDRFLILGNEGGSYYATERKLTQENASAVIECHAADRVRTIMRIVDVSFGGRAPKNDPAIFALAMLSRDPLALEVMPKVCRIGTHLFQFMEAAKHFRGRGRAFNAAIRKWYESKDLRELSYQVSKYQQRDGWSHRDILRLIKPKTDNEIRNHIYSWITDKDCGEIIGREEVTPLYAKDSAEDATSARQIVMLIRDHDLVRECIPTQWLNEREVWEALLEKMPMTAMVRNLGKMSSVGLLSPMSNTCRTVADRLVDRDKLKQSRLHPLAILMALFTYRAGHGIRGSLTWNPDSHVVDALNEAFYLSFENVEPTGKKHLLAIDISGSMTCGSIAGSFLTPRDASAAMAMLAVRIEPATHVTVFSRELSPIFLSRTQRLDSAVETINKMRMGGTDCAKPMLYALENGIDVDVFVVYTDSETWAGKIHPVQALQQYREKMNPKAKLIVCGMVSNGFSIADPDDGGMLDVVGFDTAAPQIMADFVRA